MEGRCPICGTNGSIEPLGGDQFYCSSCNQAFRLQNPNPQQQIINIDPTPEEQFIVTRKTSTGRLLGYEIYNRVQEDRETASGLDTTITRNFAASSGNFIIHEDTEIIGVCHYCGGLLHVMGHARCEYHSSNELLCMRHTYAWFGQKMCRRGYFIKLISAVLLFPFTFSFLLIKFFFYLTGQVLGVILLKD